MEILRFVRFAVRLLPSMRIVLPSNKQKLPRLNMRFCAVVLQSYVQPNASCVYTWSAHAPKIAKALA